MITSVNLQEVKIKLQEKLKNTGWDRYLNMLFLSQDMDIILSALLRDSLDGKRFTPSLSYIFKAFEYCHFNNTEIVFIGQDPYPQLNIADGLAFSCSRSEKVPQPSLDFILKAIEKTVPSDSIYNGDNKLDLSRWSQQGILLLNTALTTQIGKPNTHQLLWMNFIVTVIDSLIWNKPDLIYVFFGKTAEKLANLIPNNNYKIIVSHPASAAYSKLSEWNCEDLFNKINSIRKNNNKTKIIW